MPASAMPNRPTPKNAMPTAMATRIVLAASRANIWSPVRFRTSPGLYTGLRANPEIEDACRLAAQENRAQKRPDAPGNEERLDGLGAHMGAQFLGIFIRPFL